MSGTESIRRRVRERMERERIPIGSDDPTLLALGARPLRLSGDERRRRRGLDPIERLGDPIAKAIAIIEDSRSTHVEWVESLQRNPLRAEDGYVGDIDHHRRCIADYDHVLAVLRAFASDPEPQP